MELGPHAEDVLEIVDLVESGMIFRNPRPPLDPSLVVVDGMADAEKYRFTSPNSRDGIRWEWRELLEFAGQPDSKRDVWRKEDEVLDSVPGLSDELFKMMEDRIGPALDRHLKPEYNEPELSEIYCNLDFIISYRASFGRTLPFIERLVAIYRLGGHPCGWSGPFPEGRLVAYFPPEGDALGHAPRSGR